MHRRRFLAAAVGALAALSGCGTDGSTSTSPAATTSPSRNPPTPTAVSQPTTVPETETGLAVSLGTSRYLVRSFAQDQEQRAIEPDEITPLGEISNPLRTALEAAVEGGFRTEDVSEDLLAGIDRFRSFGGGYRFDPYFSVNGHPYAFDPTVPEFVASLDMDVDHADQDRTVTGEDLDGLAEPAAAFVRTLGAYGTMVARDQYRISLVPPAVEALLDQYDYVRDPGGVGRIITERTDPGPPYTIAATKLTAADIWGRPVHPVASLPAQLRRFVKAVIRSDRRTLLYPDGRTEYRTDELPASYEDYLSPDEGPGSGPYVEIDGTMYAVRVTAVHPEDVPLQVAVSSDSRERFELALRPSQAGTKPAFDGPLELASTWSVPGPLWVRANGNRHRLERVETVVRTADEESRSITDTESLSLPAGSELVATYGVPTELPPGTYRAWGLVRVSWVYAESDRPSPTRPFPFTVVLTVTEA